MILRTFVYFIQAGEDGSYWGSSDLTRRSQSMMLPGEVWIPSAELLIIPGSTNVLNNCFLKTTPIQKRKEGNMRFRIMLRPKTKRERGAQPNPLPVLWRVRLCLAGEKY